MTIIKAICLSVFFFVSLVLNTDSLAAFLSNDLQSRMSSVSGSSEIPIIVTFETPDHPSLSIAGENEFLEPGQMRDLLVSSMRSQAESSQYGLNILLQSRGIRDTQSLWIINGIALKATPELIDEIAQLPEVAEVKVNGTIRAPGITVQSTGPAEWNISAIGATELWALGMTGENVVIASFDTGVDILHPDLASKWRGGAGTSSWYDPYGEHAAAPFDNTGHGTSVMGLMVGGNADGTTIGVAPDAKWIAAKIFNDAGNSTFAAIHLAFQWALDPNGDTDTSDAPNIVNNSWVFDSSAINLCDTEFQPDIQALKAAGIAVVFSAGNYGPNPSTSASPANYPESLAVGAIDQNNVVVSSSARGPSVCPSADSLFPQVSAPGSNIKIADLTLSGTNPDPYAFGAGTSLAAPHVSGLMALLLDVDGFPAATVSELESAIKLSSVDLGVAGPDNSYGYGLVNGGVAAKRLGNNAPGQALLLSPAEGETDLGTSVTFVWNRAVDPDGDIPTETVVLSESGVSSVVAVSNIYKATALSPGFWFLVPFGVIFLFLRRRFSGLRLSILLVVMSFVLNSCNGGGGDGSSVSSYSVSGLKSGTTYTWKVVSDDGYGGVTDSDTRSFTTL